MKDSWLVELCQAEQMGGDWALPAETNYQHFFSKTNILLPKSHLTVTAASSALYSFSRVQPFYFALLRLPDDVVIIKVGLYYICCWLICRLFFSTSRWVTFLFFIFVRCCLNLSDVQLDGERKTTVSQWCFLFSTLLSAVTKLIQNIIVLAGLLYSSHSFHTQAGLWLSHPPTSPHLPR